MEHRENTHFVNLKRKKIGCGHSEKRLCFIFSNEKKKLHIFAYHNEHQWNVQNAYDIKHKKKIKHCITCPVRRLFGSTIYAEAEAPTPATKKKILVKW